MADVSTRWQRGKSNGEKNNNGKGERMTTQEKERAQGEGVMAKGKKPWREKMNNGRGEKMTTHEREKVLGEGTMAQGRERAQGEGLTTKGRK
jgi:hypothetical protein